MYVLVRTIILVDSITITPRYLDTLDFEFAQLGTSVV